MNREYEPGASDVNRWPMGRREFLRVAAGGALAASGAFGCGGGGNGGVPQNPGVQPLSETTRIAAMDSVKAFLKNQGLVDKSTLQQRMLDHLKTYSEFNQALITPGGVVGVFSDAVVYHIFLNQHRVSNVPRHAVTRGTEVPQGSLKALLVNCLSSYFPDIPGQVKSKVDSKGYTATTSKGDIEDLRNLGKPAFFLMCAHGDAGFVPYINDKGQYEKDANGKYVMTSATVLSTSTPYDSSTMATYRNEILRGEVTSASCLENFVGGQKVFVDRLNITSRWVAANWAFAKDSLIWIEACSSNSQLTQDLVNGCLARANNAALYVGWNDEVEVDHAEKVTYFVVDRLLGANPMRPAETPDQRPFDFVAVYNDLRSRGLHARPWVDPDTLKSDPARLVEVIFTQGSASKFGLLAPSIAYVLVGEWVNQAKLIGTFGKPAANERAVLIGGLEASVVSWDDNEIVVNLPPSGTGSAGDVVVMVRAHKSNVRRITEWNFPMRYNFHNPDHPVTKIEGQVYLRFRADVGDFRKNAHEDPIKPVRGAMATADSAADLLGSGTYTDNQGCTETWQNHKVYPAYALATIATDYLAARMIIDLTLSSIGTYKGAIGLDLSKVNNPLPFNSHSVCAGKVTDTPFAIEFGELYGPQNFPDPGEDPNRPDVPLNAVELDFDPTTFGFPGGKIIDLTTGAMQLDWDPVVPKFPPDPQAARSIRAARQPQPTYKLIDKKK